MIPLPRITLVTPSLNQGAYIRATVESVLAQDYPNLEYIVMDGGSSDQTLSILADYPQIRLVSGRDRGHWDAINQGFALASGEIWGFLNSDDTLYPGALARVAREIDPARGRHIVMGRCMYIDAQGESLEIEHPWAFESHRRVLSIWKGHTIPQPAVFWTPQVWRDCGPMRGDLGSAWIDYDLFCRFSRRYAFHPVDALLATYRLHTDSKTVGKSEADRLEECIRISRRYWGPPFTPGWLGLSLSLAWHRLALAQKASRLHVAGQAYAAAGHAGRALACNLAAAALAPRSAFLSAVYPRLKRRAGEGARGLLDALLGAPRDLAPSRVYFERTRAWEDGWAGPRWSAEIQAAGGETALEIRGWAESTFMRGRPNLSAAVDGRDAGCAPLPEGQFCLRFALPAPLEPGPRRVEVRCDGWFVPDHVRRNRDYRPLSWKPDLTAPVRFG